MHRPLIRTAIGVLLASCFVLAQQPADAPPEPTVQALLKEVHALRIAMERTNQIGPRIQIALARIQLQEEQVRTATRLFQNARDRVADTGMKRTEIADRMKRLEAMQAQTADPTARKQLDFDLTETKATSERLDAVEQQFRTQEAEANSLLLAEQDKLAQANDVLGSIERALAPPQREP